MSIENLTFLEEGNFTERDKVVRAMAKGIYNTFGIMRYVRSLHSKVKPKKFRRRTASQIISDGYIAEMSEGGGGCTDRALVFIALARALSIPARYLETLDLEYLKKEKEKGKISGHVIAQVGFENPVFWQGFDPSEGFVRIKGGRYTWHNKEYAVVGVGLDFSQVYPRTKDGFESSSVALTDIASIKQLAQKVKSLYIE